MKRLTNDDVGKELVVYKDRFEAVLPDYMSSQRLFQVVNSEINKKPMILNCTKESIISSVLEACYYGVEPSSVTGAAYLIPYGNKCSLLIGYQGILDLVTRGGNVNSVWAYPIYANDTYKIALGDNPSIEHEPNLGERGELIAVYAVADLGVGKQRKFEVLRRDECEKIRKDAKATSPSSPWNTYFESMCLKSVIRKLGKTLSKSKHIKPGEKLTDADRLSLAVRAKEDGSEGLTYELEKDDFRYVENDHKPVFNETENTNVENTKAPTESTPQKPNFKIGKTTECPEETEPKPEEEGHPRFSRGRNTQRATKRKSA